MIGETELRKQVRATLGTRGEDETMPEPLLLASLISFFATAIPAPDMMRALHWNQARGWVEKRRNEDEERDEWKLTERGRVKEGL
jgi:hypothetical protein